MAISSLQWSDEDDGPLLEGVTFLRKPFPAEQLVAQVVRLLEARAPRPRARTPTPPRLYLVGAEPPGPDVHLEVDLRSPRELVLEYTENLAVGGLFIRTYHPLPVQTELTLALALPFRSEPVRARGRVVQAVPGDSVRARTHGPGMAIALEDAPSELLRELTVYVQGLRAGAVLQRASPARRRVLLAGLEQRIPKKASAFLSRAGLEVGRAPDLAHALELLRQAPCQLVVVDGELLGPSPLEALQLIRSAGSPELLVLVTPRLAQVLEGKVATVEGWAPRRRILDRISTLLDISRREHARVPCLTHVECTRPDGPVRGLLVNVSLGGLMLRASQPFAVGERLQVEFGLPKRPERVRASATVVRVSTHPTSAELTVAGSFDHLAPEAVELLRQFIEAGGTTIFRT